MKLRELVSGFPLVTEGKNFLSTDIHSVTCYSKAVESGDLFVALRGCSKDGNAYIEEACSRGAAAVALESDLALPARISLPVLRVKGTRAFFAHCASRLFGDPSKQLNLIGVTGTNGKTTTTFLIKHIIEKHSSCALLGTVSYHVGSHVFPATLTTPDAYSINQLLAQALAQDIRHVVMEVSSHALDQDRVASLRFKSAVFTNLSRDHLDYHEDMEKYFLAKRRLFLSCSGIERAVINADDPFGRRLQDELKDLAVTYGLSENADVKASNVESHIPGGVRFNLTIEDKTYPVRSPLLGVHNIHNILAAVAETYYEGWPIEDIIRGVGDFYGISGRMEIVEGPPQVTVIVDYAHTPDAFQKVFSSVKTDVLGRLIVVFGCGGDRDREKRPQMGRIASEYADCVILTSDNPRFENPQSILDEITVGVLPSRRANTEVIEDREAAICKALDISKPHDVVLILGKGHETYQIIQNEHLRFSDQETVRSHAKVHAVVLKRTRKEK